MFPITTRNEGIVLVSTIDKTKVHIRTNTICAYWPIKITIGQNSSLQTKTETVTKVLFTNGQSYTYYNTPEDIDERIYGDAVRL